MTGSLTYELKWSNVHVHSPLLRPRSILTRSNIRFKRPKCSYRSLPCKLCVPSLPSNLHFILCCFVGPTVDYQTKRKWERDI